MAKKVEQNSKSPFEKMTSEELVARYKANVAERKRLSTENKEFVRLYKIIKAQKKPQALTTRQEALKNPKVK